MAGMATSGREGLTFWVKDTGMQEECQTFKCGGF